MKLIQGHGISCNEKPKSLPFYVSNYDPFNLLIGWNKLANDGQFGEILKELIKFNSYFIESGHYDQKDFEDEKRIFADDICIQAFLLSFQEVLTEQHRAFNAIEFIDAETLTNFGKILQKYGTGKKRTYHNSNIFSLNWFNNLISEYVKQSFEFPDRFRDFTNLGYSYEDIKKNVAGRHNSVNISFCHGDISIGYMDCNLDFNKGETTIRLRDISMMSYGKLETLSSILETDCPFVQNERLNFLFPTGCRGHILPLINVTKIILIKQSGEEIEYSHNTQKNNKITKNLNDIGQRLIEII